MVSAGASRGGFKKTGRSRSGRAGERRGTVVAAALMGRLLGRTAKRRGFSDATLLTRWPELIGPELAATTEPRRLLRRGTSGAVLELRVAPAAALEVQHLAPLIIERINTALGGRVVKALRIIQMPVRRRPTHQGPRFRTLEQGEMEAIDRQSAGIEHPGLREALRALGRIRAARSDSPSGEVA